MHTLIISQPRGGDRTQSFQDLERGLDERAPLARDSNTPTASSSLGDDIEFKTLARTVSIQIHKINANVSAITKLVDLLGTNRDTPDLRHKLHNLTDATRQVLKDSTTDVKRFGTWPVSPSSRQHKQEQAKVSSDFQKALASFQLASKRSVDRQKLFVERAKATITEAETVAAAGGLGSGSRRGEQESSDPLLELSEPQQQQQQSLVQISAVSDADLDFQEQLIQEREGEIEQIEQGITELNQIFKDLGQIVGEQQSMIDNIETNVRNVATDTRGAAVQLTQAHAYQRKAGRRMLCLLLVLILVVTVVLLAILS